MNDERELLHLRRDVLAARASMLRLRAVRELALARESVTWRELGGAIRTSPIARSAVLGTLVLIAGRRRITRIVELALASLAIAKTVMLVGKLVRSRSADPGP